MDDTIQVEATGELVIISEDETNAYYRFEQSDPSVVMMLSVGKGEYPNVKMIAYPDVKVTVTMEIPEE